MSLIRRTHTPLIMALLALVTLAIVVKATEGRTNASPLGPTSATRGMHFTGDDRAGAVRANIERAAPHVEAGLSGIGISMQIPGSSGGSGADLPTAYIGVDWVKREGSSDRQWRTACVGCGFTGDDVFGNHWLVDKYSTPVQIHMLREGCSQNGCTFTIDWIIDGVRARLVTGISLTGGAEYIRAGGGVDGDDLNDMGVAGITGIRYQMAHWINCGGPGPVCEGPWLPSDTTPLRSYFPNGRYLTSYRSSGSSTDAAGNLQVFSDCHLDGSCTFP